MNIRLWTYIIIKTTQSTVSFATSLTKTSNLNIVESFHITAVSKMSSFIVIFIFFTTFSELQPPSKTLLSVQVVFLSSLIFSVIGNIYFTVFISSWQPLVLNYDDRGQNVALSAPGKPNSIKKMGVLWLGIIFHGKNCSYNFTTALFWFTSICRHNRLTCHFLSNVINWPLMRRFTQMNMCWSSGSLLLLSFLLWGCK